MGDAEQPIHRIEIDENNKMQEASRIEQAVVDLLISLGENPDRQELRETPGRVAQIYEHILGGNAVDPRSVLSDASVGAEAEGLQVVRNIWFASLCEDHLLPFVGFVHVAYVSPTRVIELSEIARVIDVFARRLQRQERMTHEIASFLVEIMRPKGLAVLLDAQHLCMIVQDIARVDSRKITTSLMGVLEEERETMFEFLERVWQPTSQGSRRSGRIG